MEKKINHTVLIVDDEKPVGRAISRLVKQMGALSVYAESGDMALTVLQAAETPFSLILSDQRMPGMEGTDFLKKAKEIAPETVRFLITGYADIHSVTNAVNKGAVHRFITKPWDNKALMEMIRSGFRSYELVINSRHLFNFAKKQNKQLYGQTIKLKEKAEKQKKSILEKESRLNQLKLKLEEGVHSTNYMNEIESFLSENQLMSEERIHTFRTALMMELYDQFQDLANRNGFEMPEGFV